MMHRFLRLYAIILGCGLAAAPAPAPAQPFALTDSGPASPEFRERFLASYGVNSAIEPTLGAKDRPLYEKIAPFLRDDPERAIREVEKELSDDANPAFRFLLGNLHYQIDQRAEAERHLKRAIETFPDFRRAHRTLGLIYTQEGRYAEAVATWLKVITLGGGDAQSYGLLGYAYLAEGKHSSALSAYQMARMFRPESVDFRRGEAECLLRTNQTEAAAALFEELIAENPADADYWLLQANAFLELKRFDDAIANLEVVHDLGKGSSGSRFLLGDLHLQADNHTLALEHYTRAVTDSRDWKIERALQPLQHLLARGLQEEANAFLVTLKSRLPKPLDDKQATELAVIEARIGFASGRVDEAIQALEPLVERDPLHGEALLLIAEIHQEREDYGLAEFYFQRALSLPASKVKALIALGRLEVARGNLTAALDYLRTAQQLQPRADLSRYIASIEAAK